MLSTYLDESSDKQNRILVVSALFARGSAILSLENKWAHVIDKVNLKLSRQGRKPISRYHASEMNALDGEFEGWSKEESLQFSQAFLRIIRAGDLYAIAHGVILTDFVDVYPDVSDDPKGWAYLHATANCLLSIGRHFAVHIPKDRRATEGISIVFDRTIEFRARAARAFDLVRDDPKIEYRDAFNSLAEGNAFTHIALQAADLLAYEIMREMTRGLFASSLDMRKFFKKMVRGRKVQVEATYSDQRYFADLKKRMVDIRNGQQNAV